MHMCISMFIICMVKAGLSCQDFPQCGTPHGLGVPILDPELHGLLQHRLPNRKAKEHLPYSLPKLTKSTVTLGILTPLILVRGPI